MLVKMKNSALYCPTVNHRNTAIVLQMRFGDELLVFSSVDMFSCTIPEYFLCLEVKGGVLPLGGDPTVKTTCAGLPEPPPPPGDP